MHRRVLLTKRDLFGQSWTVALQTHFTAVTFCSYLQVLQTLTQTYKTPNNKVLALSLQEQIHINYEASFIFSLKVISLDCHTLLTSV